ncbi:MAG: hypothetical protein IT436_12925 [Phycisphaerales bacterium]|nr:hypothetical protein [Phycisphaerales bacterium]
MAEFQNWSRPPRTPPPRLKPKRVRGGVKISGDQPGLHAGGVAWTAQRWIRLVEQIADGPAMVEGLDYAKEGQARKFGVEFGKVVGSIQGRADRAYTTTLAVQAFDTLQWERVLQSMSDQAIYAAKLLSGELPTNIEDLFGPAGLRLFPAEPAEVAVLCTCAEGAATQGLWCKHACCLAYLFADKLAADPFLMFTLRGLPGSEVIERLRHARAVGGVGKEGAPVYQPLVPGVSDEVSPPLEESIEGFWEAGPELRELDLSLEPPPVSHPLLRRLGASPFEGARFPLVGLLATCYEVISRDAVEGADGPIAAPEPETGPAVDDEDQT